MESDDSDYAPLTVAMSLMLDFYGLQEHPFGVSPNPRFIYSSVQHRGALDELALGIEEHDGLAALIGEAGSGKTTLLLELVRSYRERADIALIFNTQYSGEALLRLIATELHIPGAEREQDAIRLHQAIASFVSKSERTKPVIIIIDEAQNLSSEARETVRLLSNVEATGHRFLHMVLAGQPRLETNLRTDGQLLQRITTISRMVPLSGSQIREYIACRLRAAGYAGPPLFTNDALGKIAKESRGIPREINRICNNALKLGFSLGQREIAGGMVEAALAELNPISIAKKRPEAEELETKTEAVPGNQDAHAQVKAEDDPWVVDAAVDLSLGDAVIDSVLSGEALDGGRLAEKSEEIAGKELEPTAGREAGAEAKACGARRPFGLGDESIEAFLSKLDSDSELEGKSVEARAPREPLEHQGTGAVVPAEAVPVDQRVSQIFAPRISKPPIRPQAASAEGEVRRVQADPRVSQIFAPRAARGGAKKTSAKATEESAPDARPASLNAASANAESSRVDDNLRDGFRPLQLPVRVPADVAIQRRVVGLAEVTKAKGGSQLRHLHAAIVIPVLAVLMTLLLLAAFAFIGSKKPPAQAKPPMPVRPPVEQSAESDTASSKGDAGSGKAKDSRAVLVKMVRPVYPADAMQSHVYGNVSLEVSIGADGLVHRMHVLSGNPVLAKAAMKAVQRWRYTPARQNGVPVPGEEKIVVSFDQNQ